jgi:hypothetical protein
MSVARPRLIGCSRLAALAAVAVACLGFSGVAQAAAPPDPNNIGGVELSHIELNGVLGTELTVAPGADVKIKANWLITAPQCRAFCVITTPTAFAGNPVAGCLELEHLDGASGTGEVDLGPAPKAPGTYNVVSQPEVSPAEGCGEVWNASFSTLYEVIARVTVPLPVPTDKQECKKGGWRELFDSNGNPFKSQGQCVRFVTTGGKNSRRHGRRR